MNNKQKIFINYYSGGCGHFFGAVLWVLLTKEQIKLKNHYNALNESEIMNQYHNLNQFWDYGDNQKIIRRIDRGVISVEQAVELLRSKVEFYSTPYDFYIGYIHTINAKPFMTAFDHSVLFNIANIESDASQISWNWFTKVGQYNIKQLNVHLNVMKLRYGRLLNVEAITEESDFLLRWYVAKFSMLLKFEKFLQSDGAGWAPRYDVQFNDIMNGHLKHKLTELADFLEVSIDTETKDFLCNMIDNYVMTQTMPIEIDIDHFS